MRCTATRRKDGKKQRCTREAVAGGVCAQHGGAAPQTVTAEVVRQVERELDAFIEPIPLTDPRSNPAYALHLAWRKSQAKIAFLERRIAETLDADDLGWGLTKEEHIGAAEFSGVNQTFEARVPVLILLLEKEQRHALALAELMQKREFAAAEAALNVRMTEFLYAKTADLLTALGLDRRDRRVREALSLIFAPDADNDHKALPSGSGGNSG